MKHFIVLTLFALPPVFGVSEDVFDTYTDPDTSRIHQIKRFTIENEAGMKVQLLDYGATIASIWVPDKNGNLLDVALGFGNMSGYLSEYGRNPYFGASIGRVSNRIANGRFILDETVYELAKNNGENHLHGGNRGFDKRIWDVRIDGEAKLTFNYTSPEGEEGYPGQVSAQITFELTASNEFKLNYQATTTRPTPVAFTNHNYFNLNGHKSANDKLRQHYIRIASNEYTPVGDTLIPTGEILPVDGTLFDLRTDKNLNELLQEFPPGPNGYDINLCVNQVPGQDLNFVARVQGTQSSITMEVYTDQPGVQFYTSGMLPDPDNGDMPLPGKDGASYWKHGGFCLETQNYPNAINQPNFPNPVLRHGETYKHSTVYKFMLSNGVGSIFATSFYVLLFVMISQVL